MGGKLNGNTMAPPTAANSGRELRDNGSGALRWIRAVVIWLQPNHEESLVGGGNPIDKIEADHREDPFNSRNRPDDVFYLLDHGLECD